MLVSCIVISRLLWLALSLVRNKSTWFHLPKFKAHTTSRFTLNILPRSQAHDLIAYLLNLSFLTNFST